MPTTFKNPVIPGFYPDASVCRSGDDYYMVATSQEYFPGLPLFHSRNLVDWAPIGHVISDPANIDLDTADDGQGLCAPTIRLYDGTYYVVSTLVRREGEGYFLGSFVCTATDPSGPWSAPKFIFELPGLDPSLFRDDNGKVYLQANEFVFPGTLPQHRTIWAQEFDLDALELVGEKHVVLDAADWVNTYGADECASFDGPRMYRKDDWYYLIIASGNTFWNHSVMAFRSRKVFGPYEACPANPLLTHRHLPMESCSFACVGHIDIIAAPGGDLWGTLLATRPFAGYDNVLGRETVLAPVDWGGEWPVIGTGSGLLDTEYPVPDCGPDTAAGGAEPVCITDAFKGGKLSAECVFIRRPKSIWWGPAAVPDGVRVALRPAMLRERTNPSFIGLRVGHFDFALTVKVDFAPAAAHEEAGLALYRSGREYFRVVLSGADDNGPVVRVVKRLHDDEGEAELCMAIVPGTPVYLRIDTDSGCYRFSWSSDGAAWNVLDASAGMGCMAQSLTDSHTGLLAGIFAGSNGQPSGNHAVFSGFKYTGTN